MLLEKISNVNNPNSWASKLRANRFQLLEEFILEQDQNTPLKLLDVGGTLAYWEDKKILKNGKVDVTCLNLSEEYSKLQNLRQIRGGCYRYD